MAEYCRSSTELDDYITLHTTIARSHLIRQ